MKNTINANTKIAAILKQNPDALEAIISISPKFNKLRNPILRKLMASRASISMASKLAGCSLNDFYNKLEPLGFIIDKSVAAEETDAIKPMPGFLEHASADDIVELDVRPIIESGQDPFNVIFEKLNQLVPKQILKLINSFEPIPLIQLMSKRGYEVHAETIDDNLVLTYFFRTDNSPAAQPEVKKEVTDWDATLQRFEGKMKTIDVREMEMPKPMMTILEEIEKLPDGYGLFVFHKRIPVYLLPELAERNFEYRAKEISDGEVHMLIFKK